MLRSGAYRCHSIERLSPMIDGLPERGSAFRSLDPLPVINSPAVDPLRDDFMRVRLVFLTQLLIFERNLNRIVSKRKDCDNLIHSGRNELTVLVLLQPSCVECHRPPRPQEQRCRTWQECLTY